MVTTRGWTLGLAALVAAFFTTQSALARCADFTPGQKPQNVGRDIVGQELDVIQDRGFIEIAVYEDFPPYSFKEKGKARGIDVDIGHLIAADLGVKARFNFIASGENLDADLRNYVWKGPLIGGRVSNIMMRVPYDSEFACRVEQVVFTGQYHNESIAIAYDQKTYNETPPVPAYFRFDPVAVENDSISDFYLSSFAGGQLSQKVTRHTTTQEAMKALASGAVPAAMGPRSELEYGLTDKSAVHEPPLPGFAKSKWTIGLAVNFRYRPLAYAVDDAVRYALDDGRIKAIFEKYGVNFTPPTR
ncbi:MAG: transporter substrate-binding domain-containing protein [Pseudomonadota bacterium]